MTAIDNSAETQAAASPTSPAVMAISHEVRRAIIACLARGIDTPSGIAEDTGRPLGVVSYHVRMLAGYGVIEIARTEPRRGALQHFYRFTTASIADFEQVRELANHAIRSARRASQEA